MALGEQTRSTCGRAGGKLVRVGWCAAHGLWSDALAGWLGDARHVGRWQHWFAGLRLRETSVIAVLCCAAAHWKELRCLLDETRGHQGDVETMGLESKLCPFTPTQNLLLSLCTHGPTKIRNISLSVCVTCTPSAAKACISATTLHR